MEISELKTAEKEKINSIVDVHMDSFEGFFLTFLGKGFLRQLYRGFVEHKGSGLIIATKDSNIIGFLAYSNDISLFYKYLIKKHLIVFAFYAFQGFIRRPGIFFRLVRALAYPNESKRDESYIELSSIGVSPKYSDLGVGTQLIYRLKNIVDGKSAVYIKLETDAENNDKANSFYKKNGFQLHHIYETREKRKMNEYRFYLESR